MIDGVGQREDYRGHRLIGPELSTEREEKISNIYREFLDRYRHDQLVPDPWKWSRLYRKNR